MQPEEYEQASRRSVAILSVLACLFAFPAIGTVIAAVNAPKESPSQEVHGIVVYAQPPSPPNLMKAAEAARERYLQIFEVAR